VRTARWPANSPPLRIAFASDLHAGPTTHPSLHAEALARLRDARPDVILLGGDYVFLDAQHFAPLADDLATLQASAGRFAVMGNHDLWADDAIIERELARAGFRVLRNEAAHLPPPWDHVSICGLDDPWTGVRDAAAAFRSARDTRVLLMHSPDGLSLLGAERFDLAVCGHTHGGHVALPCGIPIVAVGLLGRRYSHGRFDDAGATLIVSRGVGAVEVPLRLFAPPDIVVVELGA
jgi:predicted MPP superfamily phosphohydrolase